MPQVEINIADRKKCLFSIPLSKRHHPEPLSKFADNGQTQRRNLHQMTRSHQHTGLYRNRERVPLFYDCPLAFKGGFHLCAKKLRQHKADGVFHVFAQTLLWCA